MTVAAYIQEKLRPFGIPGCALLDLRAGDTRVDPDEEYTSANAPLVAVAMIGLIEEAILAPRQTSVSESGFSASWDFSKVGKYYLWLCRKHGVTPAPEVEDASGLSIIRDKTDMW